MNNYGLWRVVELRAELKKRNAKSMGCKEYIGLRESWHTAATLQRHRCDNQLT